MADPTLSGFVKEALAAGQSRAEIARALAEAGWPEDQARDALQAYADIPFPVPVPRPKAYGSAREVFLYIVYFVLLGVVAGYVGALAFAYIEYAFANPLMRDMWGSGSSGMRWGIASLLVGYPIFLYLGSRLAARRRSDPERRTSRLRVWLTYVTLIFAAGALIGDLVAVVYQFLAGELGARFIAKAAAVGLISGAILINYVRDAERTSGGGDFIGRTIAVLATLLTAALVVWAFTVVSGPGTARARIADEQRLTDIGVLTRLIDCHYTYNGDIPESLETMTSTLDARTRERPVAYGCAEKTPVDPMSSAPYSFAKIDGARYEVCAVFDGGWPDDRRDQNMRRRQITGAYGGYDERYYVDLPRTGGEACFTFEAQKFETDSESG